VADNVVRVVGAQTDGYSVDAVVVIAVESSAAFSTGAATASEPLEATAGLRDGRRRPLVREEVSGGDGGRNVST